MMASLRKTNELPCDRLDMSSIQAHLSAVEKTTAMPEALVGRGFLLEDLAPMWIAGHSNGDATFGIHSPSGTLLAVRRRRLHARPHARYLYDANACSFDPSWLSPGALGTGPVLVIMGELNGMLSWLVKPTLAVFGVPGGDGWMPRELFRGRSVYVQAGADVEGEYARVRWELHAEQAGAAEVIVMDSWSDGDACDIAGRLGRAELRARLP